MSTVSPAFIIDCPYCKAKVAAVREGFAEVTGFDHQVEEPYGERLYIGSCPVCKALLAGKAMQTAFEKMGDDEDLWSDVVRVYPKPARVFGSPRIPRAAIDSLAEADRALQANANMAACVMFGRALEAVCRDILEPAAQEPPLGASPSDPPKKRKQGIMLAKGIEMLKEKGVIDDRLYDWSQHLRAFRNVAAHAVDVSFSRQDVEDLQTFAYAIIEYIYDLADRYNEFKSRMEKDPKRKKMS